MCQLERKKKGGGGFSDHIICHRVAVVVAVEVMVEVAYQRFAVTSVSIVACANEKRQFGVGVMVGPIK